MMSPARLPPSRPIAIQVMNWASDGIANSALWTIASQHIRVARERRAGEYRWRPPGSSARRHRRRQHDVGLRLCDRCNPHGGWRAITLREKVAREHAVLEPLNRVAVAFAVRVVHRGKQVRRPTPSRTIRFSDHVDVRYEHAPVALDRFARDIWCIVSRP